jgi:thiamine biosynthesis protein ThiI
MFEVIVVHYGEIGLKGKNRTYFERVLEKNLVLALSSFDTSVYRRYGRIICQPKIKNEREIVEILKATPGIEYFALSIYSEPSIEELKKKAVEVLKENSFSTFKVETRRSNKGFPLTSLQVNRELGAHISKALNKKVSMKPDVTLYVEICEKEALLYTRKFDGVGGLPVGSSGKVVSLLSGGIDSPVASFMMAKRGCEVVFTHFFNRIINPEQSLSKIEKIVLTLTRFQPKSKLYIIPFEKLQLEIIRNVPSKYRMIVYRRCMIKIANAVAEREGAKAIVTGDNLGQVASQTIENLNTIYMVSKFPILSPLIGLNKMEIVELAKRIGTYEYSILPYQDCCSFMISPHPATRSDPRVIECLEENLALDTGEYVKMAKVLEFKQPTASKQHLNEL